MSIEKNEGDSQVKPEAPAKAKATVFKPVMFILTGILMFYSLVAAFYFRGGDFAKDSLLIIFLTVLGNLFLSSVFDRSDPLPKRIFSFLIFLILIGGVGMITFGFGKEGKNVWVSGEKTSAQDSFFAIPFWHPLISIKEVRPFEFSVKTKTKDGVDVFVRVKAEFRVIRERDINLKQARLEDPDDTIDVTTKMIIVNRLLDFIGGLNSQEIDKGSATEDSALGRPFRKGLPEQLKEEVGVTFDKKGRPELFFE